jgi:phage terminase Nu1 subunit (DNA packaging protein)
MASAAQAAAHIDLSRVAFTELIAKGVITKPTKQGGYDLTEVRLAYIRNLRKIASGRAGGSGADQLTAQRVRLATAKAEREERQNAIERGEACNVVFVRRFVEFLLLDIRNLLLNMPGEVSFLLANREQTEVHETLDAIVREKLEAIADPKAAAARATAAAIKAKHVELNDQGTEDHDDHEHDAPGAAK